MLIAVNYHYVRPSYDAPFAGIHGITPAELDGQLQVLRQLGRFVTAADVRDAVRHGRSLPATSFLLTFDDGLREQYEHALPVLESHGAEGLYFINTGPILNETVSQVHKVHILRSETDPEEFLQRLSDAAQECDITLPARVSPTVATAQYRYDRLQAAQLKYLLNFSLEESVRDRLIDRLFSEQYGTHEASISQRLYMSREQLATLGSRHTTGSHAHEHLPMARLEEGIARRLIEQASQWLETWSGYRPFAFSHPYGSAPGWVDRLLEEAGFDYAVTTERAPNQDLSSPLRLHRFNANDVPGGKRGPADPDAWLAALRASA